MKKKLPWLKYDMKKAEFLQAKEHEQEAKKKLDEAAKLLNNIREPSEYVQSLCIYYGTHVIKGYSSFTIVALRSSYLL